MPVNYVVGTKNNRLQVVVTDLGADPLIVIGTAALAGAAGVLASIIMANPSFTVAAGVMTLAGVPRNAVATGAGVAAKAELRKSDGTVIASGLTVGLAGSGADFIINATTISVGQTVQCTSGTITHS